MGTQDNMNCVLKTAITCKMDYDYSPKVVHPIPVLEDDHFPYVSFKLKNNTTATCQDGGQNFHVFNTEN